MQNLSPASRVWIYQSSRFFTEAEELEITVKLSDFVTTWTAHNQLLQASAKIYHRLFIVLTVDESQAGASGCSIDKSVHFLQALEVKYNLQLFNRLLFAYVAENKAIKIVTKRELSQLYSSKIIDDTTLVFDNLVATKSDFDQFWLRSLGESWHRTMVAAARVV